MSYFERLLAGINESQLTNESPTVLDLFSGAGGLALGFVAAGFRIKAAVEKDDHAANAFAQNIPYFQGAECLVYGGETDGDLESIGPKELFDEVGPCDVIIGGPPCKAFSRVGRGKLNSLSDDGYALDPRNRLYEKFCDIIGTFKPRAFVMENVPGMLSVNGENVAHQAAVDLSSPEKTGGVTYEVRYALLDAVWYGVPQFRQRLIFIGIRSDLKVLPTMPPRLVEIETPDGYMEWPTTGWQSELFGGLLRKNYSIPVPLEDERFQPTSVRKALDDLPSITDHLSEQKASELTRSKDWNEELPYARNSQLAGYTQLMREWDGPEHRRAKSVRGHFIRITPRDFETFRRMQPGDRYPDAHEIAEKLFAERKEEIEAEELDSIQLKAIKETIVPPYPLTQGFADRWRKLIPERPSWTVTAHLAHDTYSHIHYDSDQARAISVREAARLQSFPDRFEFGPDGGLKATFGQIGNAVPPLMASVIASHLTNILEARE